MPLPFVPGTGAVVRNGLKHNAAIGHRIASLPVPQQDDLGKVRVDHVMQRLVCGDAWQIKVLDEGDKQSVVNGAMVLRRDFGRWLE